MLSPLLTTWDTFLNATVFYVQNLDLKINVVNNFDRLEHRFLNCWLPRIPFHTFFSFADLRLELPISLRVQCIEDV